MKTGQTDERTASVRARLLLTELTIVGRFVKSF